MKESVNPVLATIAIVLVVAIAAFFIWKGVGPRTDGPSHPIDMGNIIGKDKMAPQTGYKPGMMGGPRR